MTYPSVVKSFIPKVDRVDRIIASDINAAYTEITAIETELLGTPSLVLPPGRLTLETGVPVSTTDQVGKATLYYTLTGRHGNKIKLYTTSAVWKMFALSGDLSVSLVGLTANTVYDVFVYDNNGTPTLELLAWTSSGAGTSARATALTLQDGMYVKSGATTRLYLGTILIDAAGGACTDGLFIRGVYNEYNKALRPLGTYNSGVSWTYATSTWQEVNAGTNNVRGLFVVGNPTQIAETLFANYFSVTSTNEGRLGLAISSVTAPNIMSFSRLTTTIIRQVNSAYAYTSIPAGYNYLTQVEIAISGTMTTYGTGGAPLGDINNLRVPIIKLEM